MTRLNPFKERPRRRVTVAGPGENHVVASATVNSAAGPRQDSRCKGVLPWPIAPARSTHA